MAVFPFILPKVSLQNLVSALLAECLPPPQGFHAMYPLPSASYSIAAKTTLFDSWSLPGLHPPMAADQVRMPLAEFLLTLQDLHVKYPLASVSYSIISKMPLFDSRCLHGLHPPMAVDQSLCPNLRLIMFPRHLRRHMRTLKHLRSPYLRIQRTGRV